MIIGKQILVQELKFSQQFCWGFRPFGMWYCVAGSRIPDISKDHATFTFKGSGQQPKKNSSWTA